MALLLSWDRDEHFAVDHGVSGISRKTVQYCAGMVDTGFARYPAGELLCQFLNYDPTDFLALKRRRDGRAVVTPEELARVLADMPYYRDLLAQAKGREAEVARLFHSFQRGILWQDAEDCFRLIEKRYAKLLVLSKDGEYQQNPSALPSGALNTPALGEPLRTPIPQPVPEFILRDQALTEQYRLTRLAEVVYVDLIHFLRSGAALQKCRNCGRWFLPERGYSYRYCTRPAPGEVGRICRDIGAARARQSKVEESGILIAYQRAYKRYYARVSKGKWSKSDFSHWQSLALAARGQAESQHWPTERFEEALSSAAKAVEGQ